MVGASVEKDEIFGTDDGTGVYKREEWLIKETSECNVNVMIY